MLKTIQQTVTLPAPAEKLFDMYLSPRAHGAITGGPVTISRTPGSRFRAFGGMITGRTLQVVPKRLIIQSWRGKDWKAGDIDSTLIISFWADNNGGRIELVHVNVPEYDYDDVNKGWDTYYWKPWHEYLRKKESSVKLSRAA
ncbi:MAG TPA: SRPBCC domain-containing protein [Nitrospirota bacterium]|nr:SRPBCC domain-containing protein [Nitrospirota bacterium]